MLHISNGVQDQRLAYSTDSGETFTKFSGNPVLQDPINPLEARDPKVLWYEPSNSWKMVLAHGGQNRLSIWDSPDLKSWSFRTNFTDNTVSNAGATGWEVPDLVELPIDGNPNAKRWVMIWTPAQGSPAGGNGVMYAVGANNTAGGFNGNSFTRENAGTALWADYGRDFDGTQSWSNIPTSDGRVIHTGIMQSYGNNVPTSPWRGQFAIPRELGLTQTSQGLRLTQTPIQELESIRTPQATLSNINLTAGDHSLSGFGIGGEMLELIATFDPGTATEFGLRVREGGSEHTNVGYYVNSNNMYVDRIDSGFDSWTSGFEAIHQAPVELDNGLVKLRMFVDRSTIEVFGGRGEAVISDLIFPDPTSVGVSAYSVGGTSTLLSLEAYGMQDIWHNTPAPTQSVAYAHWSMDDAGAGSAAAGNPATLDTATNFGQGLVVGSNNSAHPSNAAQDHLWTFNNRNQIGGSQHEYVTSSQTAPATMYATGFGGGASSYDAGSIAGVDGALFFPADVYGEEFNFSESFSLEIVFRSDGDKSGSGPMQLLHQGENDFRYGLSLNEGSAGNIRFTIEDLLGNTIDLDISDVTSRSFADGQWHYLLAAFDENANLNGEMALTILNEDGTIDMVTLAMSGAFSGLSNSGDGNLFVGRHTFSNAIDSRTFLGLIDEVRISNGIVSPENAIGAIYKPGDYDLDGDVDGADFLKWQRDPSVGTLADWQAEYSNSSPHSVSSAAVPEPSAIIMVAIACTVACHGALQNQPLMGASNPASECEIIL